MWWHLFVIVLGAAQIIKEGVMGFRPEPTVYKLTFEEETGLAGLTVRAKCCTMAEFNEMLRGSQDPVLDARADEGLDEAAAAAANMERLRQYSNKAADANEEAIKMFLKYLVEWDLEGENGQIVPKTLEGIASCEKPVVTKIISAWHMAMMAVPVPLKQPSSNGSASEEDILELGSASTSPQSWPKPN